MVIIRDAKGPANDQKIEAFGLLPAKIGYFLNVFFSLGNLGWEGNLFYAPS